MFDTFVHAFTNAFSQHRHATITNVTAAGVCHVRYMQSTVIYATQMVNIYIFQNKLGLHGVRIGGYNLYIAK